MNKTLGDTQDIYTPDPGEAEEPVHCGVCGAKMLVDKNQYGPTSSIMAMSGSKRHYDFFHCPAREESWHKQVVALRQEKRKTASAMIASVLQNEIELILQTKTPTK
jgi:hypothetical protein